MSDDNPVVSELDKVKRFAASQIEIAKFGARLQTDTFEKTMAQERCEKAALKKQLKELQQEQHVLILCLQQARQETLDIIQERDNAMMALLQERSHKIRAIEQKYGKS